MRSIVPLLVVVLVTSCKGREEEKATPNEPAAPAPSPSAKPKKPIAAKPIASDEGEASEAPSAAAPKVKKPFAVGTFDKGALPKDAKLEGTIEGGLAWTDALGDNVAAYTRRESKSGDAKSVYLRVYHYANGKLIREVRDQIEKCEFDNLAAFKPDSFHVEDSDKNGVGELRFGYIVDCASDVSPQSAKLLVLEAGSKAILRGSTLVKDGGEVYGGKFAPDPAAEKWKPTVLDGAKAEWKRLFGG